MRKASTIRDVAREAGVSIAVVSRVLNDGTGPVALATRAKVVEAIEALDYRPRDAARELQGVGSTTIGLVLADLANPFFARLADRVVWEARARGVQVLLLTTQEDPRFESDSIDTLIGRSVGSVIATPTVGNASKWQRLMDRGVTIVFVDRELDGVQGADVVTINNSSSAVHATRHLIELGHQRIAFISGPLTTSTGRERLAGFTQTMNEAGLQVDEELIHAIPFRGDAGGDVISTIVDSRNAATAVIVGNTAQVLSSLRRLKLLGVRIPEDLSVVAFDDNPWTDLVTPPLTVIRQPIDMLAVHSVELAIGRARGQLTEAPQRISVDAEFVRRASTAVISPSSPPTANALSPLHIQESS